MRATPLAIGLLSALVACGDAPRSVQAPAPSPRGSAAGGDPADEIEALTALGYAGDVEIEEGATGGVVFRDAQRSAAGYGLYTMPALSRAELIDGQGRAVHAWVHPDEAGGPRASLRWYRSILTREGDLIVVGADVSRVEGEAAEKDSPRVPDEARYLMRLNWRGELLWKRQMHAHHDVEITPSGQILTLTFQRRDIPNIHPDLPVRVDKLALLEADGTLIESRSLLQAVRKRPDLFPLTSKAPDRLGGEPWVDLFHSNSCEWMRHPQLVEVDPIYAQDNVLVCFRHQHCIAIFNWTRNEVVWAWGKGEISGPHDAQVMEDGKILLFDNGLGLDRSRAILLDPLKNEIVWEWQADPPEDFYTASQGAVQKLPNGNFLLTESEAARVLEITPTGERVWEFLCPHTTAPGRRAGIARMYRHPLEFVDAILATR